MAARKDCRRLKTARKQGLWDSLHPSSETPKHPGERELGRAAEGSNTMLSVNLSKTQGWAHARRQRSSAADSGPKTDHLATSGATRLRQLTVCVFYHLSAVLSNVGIRKSGFWCFGAVRAIQCRLPLLLSPFSALPTPICYCLFSEGRFQEWE